MTIFAIDDEKAMLEELQTAIEEAEPEADIHAFRYVKDVLNAVEKQGILPDVVFSDIEMPGTDGLHLAARIKQHAPRAKIVLVTGYSQYALDAFSVHANGYLMKPVMEERLSQEIACALAYRRPKQDAHILVRTFSGFDVFVDGRMVAFSQAKCKELLAFLVDRQGNSVTRAEAFAALWEDRTYDRAMQKLLDNIIRSMRQTLSDYRIGEMFEMQRGTMRVCPETFSCDAYQFFEGNISAVSAFRGEYMGSYSWASITESYMEFKSRRQ